MVIDAIYQYTHSDFSNNEKEERLIYLLGPKLKVKKGL